MVSSSNGIQALIKSWKESETLGHGDSMAKNRLIPLTLDLRYTLRAARVPLHCPSSLPDILKGPKALDRHLQEEYSKRPIEVKHTHGFDIFLNPADTGISPSIGVLGWYELRTTELLGKLLGKEDRVVDVWG